LQNCWPGPANHPENGDTNNVIDGLLRCVFGTIIERDKALSGDIMTKLAFSSFEIHGFRAFEHLKLEKLGRVNLFTGKNNVGKTSLLEALWVYANQGAPSVLWSLLEGRDEGGPLSESRMVVDEDTENQIASVRYLFNGRKQLKAGMQKMEFGLTESINQHVVIRFTMAESVVDEQGIRRITEVQKTNDEIDTIPAVLIQSGKNSNLIRLERLFVRNIRDQYLVQMERPCVFLPASGLTITDIGKYWDNITLSSLENDVLDTMKIIEPDIERINLIGTQKLSRLRERIPIVKVNSFDSPIPLRSLGEGMNRMLGIALAMVNSKGGVLLVDEIESGLHYSVLPEMWRFIFQAAQRLNVQVFATTHSWDCITGFQQSAVESDQDGMLIRLVNKKGKIVPTFFDEKDLSIATREQIEVR